MVKSVLCLLILFLLGCNNAPDEIIYPKFVKLSGITKLADIDSIPVMNSGFGSGVSIDPKDPTVFYLLTDRGLNFWRPDQIGRMHYSDSIFTPQIGRFKFDGSQIKLDTIIKIHTEKGNISGRTRPHLTPSDVVLDPEGLTVTKNGDFWISDEHLGAIVKLSPLGLIERIISPKTESYSLPKTLINTVYNKSLEGITITPNAQFIYTIVQGSLQNPDVGVLDSTRVTRIIRHEIATGINSEYIYVQEHAYHNNSGISAITDSTFLIIEHGGTKSKDLNTFKKVFKITIREQNKVYSSRDNPAGKQYYYRTIEQLSESMFNDAGIVPVKKELVMDLVSEGYPHEKPEGIVYINPNTFGITNDNDFGLALDKDNNVIQKQSENGEFDWPFIYFYKTQISLLE